MILKTIKRIFGGASNKVEKNLKKKEIYWEGLLAEKKSSVSEISEKLLEIKAKINSIDNTISETTKIMELYKSQAKENVRSGDEQGMARAEACFNKYKKLKSFLEAKQTEKDILDKTREQMQNVYEIAQREIEKLELEIVKVKSKLSIAKTVDSIKDMTSFMDKSNTSIIQDMEDVDIEFEKAKIIVGEFKVDTDVDKDNSEFEEFLK